ncbi:MAG: DUF2973 domain-containing protein [Synechococcales bacterium]|nr:DUF2973 domain-containing protein [Synechococcales bacterium]
MWLQILYIAAFSIISVLAIANLIRNMIALGMESQRFNSTPSGYANYDPDRPTSPTQRVPKPSHPEMLDENGRVINEPLLVMRSMSVDDARERLDAIYRSSPGGESSNSSEEET